MRLTITNVSFVVLMAMSDVASAESAMRHNAVRSSDAALRTLITKGAETSPTFVDLCERIATMRAIVYVEWTMTLPGTLEAALMHRVSGAGDVPVFWVGVRRTPAEPRLVPVIAHELHRVLEALEQRRTSTADIFSATGSSRITDTDDARRIQAVVEREQRAGAQAVSRRIRTSDPALAAALERGTNVSATFRRITETIEHGDWLVFVQSGPCPDRRALGCLLHVVGEFEGRKYLRVLVNPRGRNPEDLIVTIAHELQHAAEIVSREAVHDGPAMLALFKRISSVAFRTSHAMIYETAEAQRVEASVWSELRQH